MFFNFSYFYRCRLDAFQRVKEYEETGKKRFD
jgi:hypothetical protein